MGFDRERDQLEDRAERKGPDGFEAYWDEKDTERIDGLPGLGVGGSFAG